MPHQQIAHQIKVVADYIRVHVAQYGTEAIDRQLHILDVNHSTLIGTASAASTNHSAAIVAQINFNRIYCNEKIHRNILSGITQTPSLTSTQQSPEPNYLEFIPLRVWLKKPGGGAWTADDIGDCIFEIELFLLGRSKYCLIHTFLDPCGVARARKWSYNNNNN